MNDETDTYYVVSRESLDSITKQWERWFVKDKHTGVRIPEDAKQFDTPEQATKFLRKYPKSHCLRNFQINKVKITRTIEETIDVPDTALGEEE